MSALKFSALVICLIGCAYAAEHSGSCGTMPTSGLLFGNSSATCAKATACQTAYCSCVGRGAPVNWVCASSNSAKPNCTVAAACIATKTACINAAADDNSAGCSTFKDLQLANLGVASGTLYNASAGYKACVYESCLMLNSTSSTANCTIDASALCPSPVNFIATLILKGAWSGLLNNAAKKAALAIAFAKDLSKAIPFPITIRKLFIKTNRRRQSTTENLAVEFQASGVSANNAALKTAFEAAKNGNGAFLTEALAAYKAENGGAGFTFVGVSAGSASSAVFTPKSSTGSRTTTTTTGTAAPRTNAPGSRATTTTTTTGATTGSSDDATDGASAQSVFAAVVVAVLGSLLF